MWGWYNTDIWSLLRFACVCLSYRLRRIYGFLHVGWVLVFWLSAFGFEFGCTFVVILNAFDLGWWVTAILGIVLRLMGMCYMGFTSCLTFDF